MTTTKLDPLIFVAALYLTAKKWKQSVRPATHEYMNKLT